MGLGRALRSLLEAVVVVAVDSEHDSALESAPSAADPVCIAACHQDLEACSMDASDLGDTLAEFLIGPPCSDKIDEDLPALLGNL